MTITRELARAAANIRKKGTFLRGLLGDFDGAMGVPGRDGYFFVRVEKPGGYEVGVFPGRVRPLYNLPVRIETHPLTNVQYIADVDNEALVYSGADPAGVPTIDLHGDSHGWGGDDMPMWLHTAQLFPLRCQPHETESQWVQIQAGTYFSQGVFSVLYTPFDVDLSAYFPSTGRKFVLLYLNADGTAGVQDDGATRLVDLTPAPSGTYWLAAVELNADSVIGWQNIVDLRFMNSGVINGGELLIGTDHIVVGTDHPSTWGRWTRIGHQLDALLCSTRATGMMASDDSDFIFLGMDWVAPDEARATVLWGDNSSNKLYFVFRPVAGCQEVVGTMSSAGDWWLAGNIEQETGATVDGVDVSAHDHSPGSGGPIPFTNLSDVPDSYAGQAGQVVTVNPAETGLVFGPGGGVGAGYAYRWNVDGALAIADEIDSVWIVQEAFTPLYVWLYCQVPGSAGSTIVDVQKSINNGLSWVSLFATGGDYPELAFNGGHVAHGVPDAVVLSTGTLLRARITQVATGAANASVQFAPIGVQSSGGLLTMMGVG